VNIGWGFGPGGVEVSAPNGRLIVHGQRVLETLLAAYESGVADRTVALPLANDDPVFVAGTAGLQELDASPATRAMQRGIFGVYANGRSREVTATEAEA
jgi:hypothetical protein